MSAFQVFPHQEDLSVQNYFPHRPFNVLVCRRDANLIQLILAHAAFLKVNFPLFQEHLKCLQGMNSLATFWLILSLICLSKKTNLKRRRRSPENYVRDVANGKIWGVMSLWCYLHNNQED